MGALGFSAGQGPCERRLHPWNKEVSPPHKASLSKCREMVCVQVCFMEKYWRHISEIVTVISSGWRIVGNFHLKIIISPLYF